MTRYTVDDVAGMPLPVKSSDLTIEEVVRTMLAEDNRYVGIEYEGDVLGIVTFRSLTRAVLIADELDQESNWLSGPVTMAISREYPIVHPEDDLFELFSELTEWPYVLVQSDSETGRLIRDVDFHQFLEDQLHEILIIEDIERSIRDILRQEFGTELSRLLQNEFDDFEELRTPTSIEDCSFRHYSIFMSTKWDDLGHRFDHQSDFVRDLLDQIAEIRNRLFHFRADELGELDTDVLEFARHRFDVVSSA